MLLSRTLRDTLKSGLHRAFLIGQRIGWDILPRHFYSSVPDIRHLENSDYWKQPSSMIGVQGASIDSQLQFLSGCCPPPIIQRLKREPVHPLACRENGESGFGPVEADFLYSFIATQRPPVVVQIGCGVSTAVILLAAKETGYSPKIRCIDPFPTAYLRRIAGEGLIQLIPEPAQQVQIDTLVDLSAGDLLFVDSTHAVRPGSEVNRVILEVLPRLSAGVLVHFHDIYFPFDYQSNLLTSLFFAAESTLLHAFLINNPRFAIAVSLSMLHHACPERVLPFLPNYRPAPMPRGLHSPGDHSLHFPSSLYLSVSG